MGPESSIPVKPQLFQSMGDAAADKGTTARFDQRLALQVLKEMHEFPFESTSSNVYPCVPKKLYSLGVLNLLHINI